MDTRCISKAWLWNLDKELVAVIGQMGYQVSSNLTLRKRLVIP